MRSAEELYNERVRRVEDAIALRTPDRVPVILGWGFFPARYVGISYREYMYDPEKITAAAIKVFEDFQPDMVENPFGLRYLGPLLDALDYKQLLWPGHGLADNVSYQFVEGEYMKDDEYDHFINDPTDWLLRRYLPRICGALAPFRDAAPWKYLYSSASMHLLAPLGTEEASRALDALKDAGRAAARAAEYSEKFRQEMRARGFPIQFGGATQAPFDTLGDFFRGTRGVMVDIYRRPDKLLKALEVLTPWLIEMGVSRAKDSENPRVFIALHKGSNEFLSVEQFSKFFWPGLRDVMLGLIQEGLTPVVFFESDYTSRLEIIADIPPGKAVYWFENTDIFKAKEVLGDRVCLRGNVPISLLCLGTPDDVRAKCKELIDTVGRDGGFIMDASTGVEDARTENVRVLIEFTREYGVYS